jgi:hypothetical protein
MPAYKVALETKCIWDRYGRCKKRATHTVYNRYNESMGTYCMQHANGLLKKLNTVETITQEVVDVLNSE